MVFITVSTVKIPNTYPALGTQSELDTPFAQWFQTAVESN